MRSWIHPSNCPLLNVCFQPISPLQKQQVKPPTVIGQFHTLFFGSVRMFFLGVLGFAVYGNEALHFSCDPDKREINLFCYNQFRPITPQVSFLACAQTLTPQHSYFLLLQFWELDCFFNCLNLKPSEFSPKSNILLSVAIKASRQLL